MTTTFLDATSNFTVYPTDAPQHVSTVVPISCIAIALTVFLSLGYAYYKDLYVPKNEAEQIETADFDFQSRDHMGRRASVVYAQMLLLRVRCGLQNAFHCIGESILTAGTSIKNTTSNIWQRRTRNDYETNTFYMGVNKSGYQRGEEEQLLI